MKKKQHILLSLLLGMVIFFTGCQAAAPNATGSKGDSIVDAEIADKNLYDSPNEASLDSLAGENAVQTDRKVIVTVSYNLETKDLDASVSMIEDAVKQMGGYYESSSVRGSTKAGGRGEYVLRIPSNKLNEFTNGVGNWGNIVSQNRTGKDVTSDYYDTETRLSTLRIQYERIEAILKEAKGIEEIIRLETELTRIQTQIERLTTTIKKYDNLIDYCTVNISISQVDSYTKNTDNFLQNIADTFMDSLEFFTEAAKTAILILTWCFPYIVIIVIVVVVILRVEKSRKNKKKQQKNDHKEE